MPISKTEDYWTDSLDPEIIPGPVFTRKWEIQVKRSSEVLDLFWDFIFSSAGVKQMPKLMESALDHAKLSEALRSAKEDLERRGLHDQAESVTKAISELDRLADPKGPVFPWMKLVIGWAPYLDSHAVRGRYPSRKDLTRYFHSKDGVKNLVGKASEIMGLSKLVIKSLKGNP